MPTPIGLVSQQSSWDYFTQGNDDLSFSDIQKNILEMSGIEMRAASKTDARVVVALEMILKNEAEDLTAVAEAIGTPRHVYTVPTVISDYELISLKTAGMVQGHGRAVSITEKGREAIRMYWLDSSNRYKESKTSDYVHPWSKQASDDNNNTRTASKNTPRRFATSKHKKFRCEE